MRIDGIPGQYAFHALVKNGNGWRVTSEVFFTREEAVHFNEPYETIWPIEIQEGAGNLRPRPHRKQINPRKRI